MNKNRTYKAKYFALSFCASFFVWSLLFLFLITTTHPDAAGVAPSAGLAFEPVYQPEEADALTLLLFGTERPDSVADAFLLLRFDPLRGEVSVAAFPPQTVLLHGSREETLSDAYRYGGAAYTREALSTYLGVPIDRYARISLAGFITAAAAVGTVEYELSEDLLLNDGDLAVTLHAGAQLLDGRMVAALIRNPDYPCGESQRGMITAELVCAVINQRIDVVNSTLSDKIFETVINLVDTDISYSDYEQRLSAARHMAARSGPVARPIPLQGQFSQGNTRYTLADTALAGLARRFF